MQRIESAQNPRLKRLRKMASEGYSERWIIEGDKLLAEALASGIPVQEAYVREGGFANRPGFLRELESRGIAVYEIPASLMNQISTMETPPGLLAVAPVPLQRPPQRLAGFAAVLLSVRDPGNMGTLLRSAEASGCEFIACSPDCANPHQPKVVRASMGSIFRVPIFKVPEMESYIQTWKMKATIYGLYPHGGASLREVKPRFPALILIGGEASGIEADMKVDVRVTIPMKGEVESLNAAMAGTLCFYHFQSKSE